MIDTKELRQLAQDATPGLWYVGSGTYEGRNIYSVASVTDDEGFTYQPIVASAEDDGIKCWDANARLIAAAPTMYEYIASSASNGCAEARKIMEAINAGR